MGDNDSITNNEKEIVLTTVDGEKYVIKENDVQFKRPTQPLPENYHDLLETEEERLERIYLYS